MTNPTSKTHYAGDSNIPEILEVHVEGGNGDLLEVEVTLAVEANFEGLVAGLYMDGSYSMNESGNYGARGLARLAKLGRRDNPVENAMRVIAPFVASLDATGTIRVAYWATGNSGQDVEVVGEMDAHTAANASFPGPKEFGNGTFLLPAIRDFVTYTNDCIAKGEQAKVALAVFASDGQLHDADEIITYVQTQLVPAIMAGKFPRTHLNIVGIGRQVDQEQLEELEHEASEVDGYKGREIFHGEHVDTIGQLPELVAHLIEADRIAFTGGATIVDPGTGAVIKVYEGDVPAVLELEVPKACRQLVLRAPGHDDIPFLIPREEH